MTPYRTDRQKLGQTSEQAAAAYLRERGLRIVVQNYRCRYGEMDLVARDEDQLVFVEVRSSRDGHFANPKESVGSRKKRTLSMVALNYLKERGLLDRRSRFDVIIVIGEGDCTEIEWLKNAFEGVY